MKIKHKVQKNLNPTFQAELNHSSLCGLTQWWQWVVCVGSGDWPCSDCQVHICLGDGHVGSEAWWASALLASSGQCCAAPWDSALMGGMRVGTLGPLALRLSIPSPSLQALHRRSPKPPSLCWFSQNPAFTLPMSELLLVLFFYLRLWAQDCESVKPPRSRFRYKHMRNYLHARSCVQVYWQCGAGTSIPRWVFA